MESQPLPEAKKRDIAQINTLLDSLRKKKLMARSVKKRLARESDKVLASQLHSYLAKTLSEIEMIQRMIAMKRKEVLINSQIGAYDEPV